MKEELKDYHKICKLSDLKEETGKQFFVDDIEIAVFKVKGKVYALSNICPHQKVHLIYEGIVDNNKVICPIHGWEFELSTGNLGKERKGLNSYQVIVENEDVYVKVYKQELNW